MNINKTYNFLLSILLSIAMALVLTGSINAQVVTVTDGAMFHLNSGAVVSVNGGMLINSGGTFNHSNAGASNLWFSGKFENYGFYIQNDFGILRFYRNLQDSISGADQAFERIWVMKTGTAMVSLSSGTDITINKSLRLISNNIFNINRSNLTIEKQANLYPDSVSTYLADPLLDSYNSQKFVMTSGEKDLSGAIIRKIPEIISLSSDLNIRFPIGTPLDTNNPVVRNYSPARFVFAADEATTGTNAFLSMRCIAAEHPHVEVNGVSLRKYWKTDFNDIFVAPGGYNVRFNYNDNEVQGTEEDYMLCLFYRPYDGPNGTYYINAGAGYGIESVNNRFYIDEVNKKDTLSNSRLLLDGEWSAGQEEAVNVYYYSIANGDWENPSTWSKQGYTGAPSTTYPTTENDKVFVGNGKTVTVSATTPVVNAVRVQQTGRLAITSYNSSVQGDSLFVENGGTLAVSSDDGFTQSSILGNVQTTHRIYSQFGIYEYIGTRRQVTGDGLPDIVGSLVINKPSLTDTVSLTKSVLIKDSLVINEGTFHLFRNGNFTAHGETGDTTNRRIIMRGGEFSLQNFPIKYKNALFNSGTITFDGTGSFKIPSSASPGAGEPAVTQYHNIKLKGSRAANTYCTFDPTGEIRINGDMNISGLAFDPTPLSDRFIVTGSTVVFNGTADQLIQTGYPSPTALIYRPKFHKLVISGSGSKTLQAPNDINPSNNFVLIRDTLVLNSGNFISGSHHIRVLSGWRTVVGSTFDAGSGLVTFEADGKAVQVRSSGISFNNINITGTSNGEVRYLDSISIAGNLDITTATLRDLNNTAMSIRGNFINQGAFAPQTGHVHFTGSSSQTITHSGRGTFYNLSINKSSGAVLLEGDSLIKVSNNLNLIQGNIGGRNSVSVPNKPLVVDGNINRTGVNPGHIDGRLRLPTTENANSKIFTIGYANDYMPMNLDITGFGGAAGYVDAYLMIDTDVPNLTRTIIETQVPNGPELDSTKNVRKVWVVHADTTSSTRFQLGAARQYNAELFFNANDIRNGALTSNFEIYQRDTTTNTGRWKRPILDTRTASSTKFINNNDLDNNATHYFIIGEPKVFTYFSIADGNFNAASTWSTAGYLSSETALRAPNSNDNIRIGNGKLVTITANHTINANRTLIVETGGRDYPNGHLIFDDDDVLVNGGGVFILDSGAAITIRHNQGIVNSGNQGCVRTTTRDYNFNNHNSGHFIYARSGNQATGSGFPAVVRTLQVDKSSGTLTFSGSSPIIQQVTDSVYFARGTVTLTPVILKVAGNFVINNNASFTPGTQYISNQGSFGENNRRDSVVWPGVVIFNGGGTQYIQGTYNDATNPLAFNRFTISKREGILISKFNIRTNVLFFSYINRANIDVASFNKYFQVHNPLNDNYWLGRADFYNTISQGFFESDLYGYVKGRLIRFIDANETGRAFPIGTGLKYAPAYIQRNEIGANTGQTGGMLEIQVVNGNHPNFRAVDINQNTNIQRYYEITRPIGLTPEYVQGNRALSVQLFFTQDEPRGGISPLDYSVFRLLANNTWSNNANITTGSINATNLKGYPNNPTLGANNIFTAVSVFTGAPSITLMIGQAPPPTPERIFYSRSSGNWNDPNTWSYSTILFENTEDGYALNTNSVNDYPRLNIPASRDFAIIGAGDSVYFNVSNVDLRYVLLEKSASGVGKLVMPGESYIRTEQFVQKNGGKLFVGSINGIVQNSTSSGNIRQFSATSIINFNWNNLGNNNFAYIGAASDAVQNTGSGLPSTVASLEIDYNRNAANRFVDLTNNSELTIRDSLVFKNGRLRNRDGNRTLVVKGDIVNNSNDVGFHNLTNPSNRKIFFDDTLNQTIRGTAAETRFVQAVNINKSKGTITSAKNIRMEDSVQFRSNTIFNLNNNTILTFGNNAIIDSLQAFNSNRLFKVSGDSITAKVRKTYPTGTSNQTFTFPIGEDSLGWRSIRYGEARFALTGQTYAANNYLELTLRSNYPHPNAGSPNPNILRKYWSVSTSGISLTSTGKTSARFKYNDPEVIGNILQYRPALYRRADVESRDPGWSFELFNASNLQIDTTNKFIIVDSSVTLANHDWTAGNPNSFVRPRLYWSRANGDWSNPNIWTNYNFPGNPHLSDVPALNSPGFFEGDTVIIGASHLVFYDKTSRFPIDSLGIGISNSVAPELRFLSTTSTNKSLNIRGNLNIGSSGLISKDNVSGSSIDTLYVSKIFENNGNTNRGVDFHPTTSRNIRLSFIGNSSSFLKGEGFYNSIGTVRVLKADSTYNLHNESQSFSTKFSQAVTTIPSVDFILDAGMYYHDNAANITLSTDGDGDVFLGDLVGLVLRNGNVTYSDGLICGQNASVWLLNGNLTIGNQKDENFQYESVTIINIQGGSNLLVAGSMRRRFLTSAVDFRLKDSARIEVMRKGATTNTSERRAAFDFGEANSVFTMNGGRVVIYRPMELSLLLEKDPDYFVNATISFITGGTVQFGHPDSSIVGENFNLIASAPFWNLDLANTYSKDLLLGSPIITVRNDLTIRDASILNQNGNTLNIGGDFTIAGQYKSGTVGPRRVSFFGNSTATPPTKQNQIIRIKNSNNDAIYDLVINKSNGGLVELSNDPAYLNSNFIVKNTLEFAIGNTALISAPVGRFVQVGTEAADLASIQRFGLGHINGELRRWINNGAHSKLFTVGTATDYTPAQIVTSFGSGTQGLLAVTAYGIEHPDLINSSVHQPGTGIDRYWKVQPAGTPAFALGSGRNYELTLFFKKGLVPSGDQKVGSSFGTFEHFRRTPAWSDPAGLWYLTTPDFRTDSSTSSILNSDFGDFVIAEIAGARFYSRQSGNWNDINTWSNSSYTGAVAARLPNVETDRVFVGNGRVVTINNVNPRVRSVTVEKNNSLPGKIVILDERYIRGLSFELRDSCYLATDDAFGFTAISGPNLNIGAIRSSSVRSYGKGIIEYIGELNQAMGDGPSNPKTIIVNNTGILNKTVSFSNSTYTIEDSLYAKLGFLSLGNATLNIKGSIVADSGTRVVQGFSNVNVNGIGNQYFVMNDSLGMNLYNLNVRKTSGNLILAGSYDSNSVNIHRRISFDTTNTANINSRLFNKNVVLLSDTITIARIGLGHIDGRMLRPFGSGAASYIYPIGYNNVYLPSEITITAGAGSAGYIAGIAMSPPNPNASRVDPNKKVNYYWNFEPRNGFSLGNRLVNTKFTFPATEISNLSGGVPNNAILLRKTNPIETPLWKKREFAQLSWNVADASVQITNPADYWTGLGEFYIGERYRLTFYSKASGVWNDHRTWALDAGRTMPAPEGEYPNPSIEDLQDSVVIGWSDSLHNVRLNVANSTIGGLTLLYNGRLDLHNNGTSLGNIITSSGIFNLLDSSFIAFGGNVNPTSAVLQGFTNYNIGSDSYIEFYGTQTLIANPFGLPNYSGNVFINGLGTKIVASPITIMGNLVLDGNSTLDIQEVDALSVRKNVFNRANIMNRGILEIGE